MALERVRAKRKARAGGQLAFLKGVAARGIKLFGIPTRAPKGGLFAGVKRLEPITGRAFEDLNDLVETINTNLAQAGIELSRKVIEVSDKLTDLAAEVSPLNKDVEKVLDRVLDFPTDAYFRAWIFTLQFYLDAIETAKEQRKVRMKVAPGASTPPTGPGQEAGKRFVDPAAIPGDREARITEIIRLAKERFGITLTRDTVDAILQTRGE